MEPSDLPILDYRSPAHPHGLVQRLLLWMNPRAMDSALACSSLLFAILAWVYALFAIAMGSIAAACCIGGILAAMAMITGLFSLLEYGTSRVFSVASLFISGIYLFALAVAWRLIR